MQNKTQKKNVVCVVLPSNIHWAPYYYRYEELLLGVGCHIELLMWNRENIEEVCKANIIEFSVPDISDNHNPFKVTKFIKYCKFVRNTLKENCYEKVVFLGTYAGTIAFLSGWLKQNMPKQYWIDIRDYTYEWFKPYYLAEKKAIAYSNTSAISSYGFRNFLPSHDYIMVHNIDRRMEKIRSSFHKVEGDGRIRISFIGNVRYMDENIKFLNVLKNDDRFILQYYGAGSENVQKYCAENGIQNVDFFGRFSADQTQSFYEKTDIINNLYGNDSIGLTTALSNKFYYAAALHIPVLVCPNTCMEEYTQKYGFGFFVDYNDPEIGTRIYNWYSSICDGKIIPRYDDIWEQVNNEDAEYDRKFIEYILE